jgi:hypothetical protein
MYGSAIDKICYWLDKAVTVAENAKQQQKHRQREEEAFQ